MSNDIQTNPAGEQNAAAIFDALVELGKFLPAEERLDLPEAEREEWA